MKIIGGTLIVLLTLVVLPSLTLAFPTPVPNRAPAGDDTAMRAAVQPAAPTVAPAPATPPLDCTNPLPGPSAKLVDDDEILVSFGGSADYYYSITKLDNKHDGSANLVHDWDWRTGNHNYYWWPAGGITTADLDGDGKAEVVSASQDPTGRLQVVALKNPEVDDPSQLSTDSWLGATNPHLGLLGFANLAAGNLDGSLWGGDPADEVVLAFQGEDNRLHVILLDGKPDGGITQLALAEWSSANHGRSYISAVIAVAVGDVDSNGYDDDIVLAFVDGDKDVQVVILKLNQAGGVTEMGWNYWTDHDRGDITSYNLIAIAVATGDFDRDFTDEIAVAFRDGTKALQVMNVEYDPSTRDVKCLGWWRNTSHHRNEVNYVSVAAADIDGDSYQEIVTAFQDGQIHLAVVTLDAEIVTPTLHGSWSSGFYGGFIAAAAGNIDGQGTDEVVLTFAGFAGSSSNPDLKVVTYNDNPACPCPDDSASGLIRRSEWIRDVEKM